MVFIFDLRTLLHWPLDANAIIKATIKQTNTICLYSIHQLFKYF